jgi:hypothetical protein
MSLNLEEFNIALESFGTVTYSLIFPSQGNQTEYFEFAVQNVNYLYSLSNFGEFCKNKIVPYYPNLIVLSMDNISLRGAFKK